MKKISGILRLIREGKSSVIFAEIKKRFKSESICFGLRRDMMKPFKNPDAKIPISVRKIEARDTSHILDEEFQKDDPRQAEYQQAIIDSGLKTGYVAVDEHDTAAYMQYLMGAEQNDLIQSHFNGTFPVLKNDEGLLEAAFMNPKFRGQRIMPAAMARIAEQASDLGLRWTITFVDVTNIPSLKGCHRAGFSPYIVRLDKWFLFKRTVSYKPIESTLLVEYEQNMGISPAETVFA
ncbi:MAG: N-acetyltransferase [Balneolia bacterium]|nr:N-acetyltransferase [Balneolia bacterium]